MNGNLTPLGDLLAAADEFEAKGSKLADSLRLLAGELWVRRLFYVQSISFNTGRYIPESEVTSRAHIPNSFMRLVNNNNVLHELDWNPVFAEVFRQLTTGELALNGPQGPDDHDEDYQQPRDATSPGDGQG